MTGRTIGRNMHDGTEKVSIGPDAGINRYYAHGNYEKETGAANRELHYISAGTGVVAIYEKISDQMYYVHTDHLGSINVITSQTGAIVEEMSFDAWGRRRNPINWTYTGVQTTHFIDRGYTGHEHLDKFGAINMNGRIYDPVNGRFFSPDKFVQSPGFTQSYNRYSYCMNNPLKYIDPSGWYTGPYTDGELPVWAQEQRNWNAHTNPHNAESSNASWIYNSSPLSNTPQGQVMHIFRTENSGRYNSKGEYGYAEQLVTTMEDNVVIVNARWVVVKKPDVSGKNIGDGPVDQGQGAPLLESSNGALLANGFATIIDGSVILSELSPSPIIPRRAFNNVKASAAAGKLIAKGNVLLTWVAVGADGIDIYNNRAKATNADYTKWGVDIGLATAGTALLAVATFVPGVNVVAWGIALFAVSTANTYGAFDPLYQKLNR